MKHCEGDYVLLSDIKDVDELNAVHDALVAGSGEGRASAYPYHSIDNGVDTCIAVFEGVVSRAPDEPFGPGRRLTVDQVLGRTPAYIYIVMDGTVEIAGPMDYEDACDNARACASDYPGGTYTVCMVCRVFKGRVVVDESSYGEGE